MAATPSRRSPRRADEAMTIYDVAEAAGVSTATVSRVVNGNYPVSAATRSKVEAAMQRLGYVTNAHARALAGSGRRLIGILIEELGDPYFASIARGAQLEAAAYGRLSLVCNTRGSSDLEDSFLDLLLEHRADVVVVVGGATSDDRYQEINRVRATRLASTGCRLVLCARPPLTDVSTTIGVQFDNEQGAFAVTDHLLALGHRRILYLGGPPTLSTTMNRIAGFERAHRTHGRSVDPTMIITGPFTQRWGYQRMQQLLDAEPAFTAVFCGNDLVAAGAYQAIKEQGLTIPGDLSVVGYDDIPIARVLDPALTTVRVPTEAIGREAVRAGLAHLADGPADPYTDPDEAASLGTSLIIRGSTAEPRD
ncbi:LacI family DNA-binding transcriptional regulator [Microlunatus soli]|uniref:Transcriptional regulator, LacI family n=1 Tax=Microlunatus soli TaxID=630515 RepID=A0A1H1WBZ2_9ACTN|nr:LacI family DNA-binding transcriptional regulator [Microlunatus soli]SDS93669.1 transcriptional regulator, LacI family [Microlunatus soli]